MGFALSAEERLCLLMAKHSLTAQDEAEIESLRSSVHSWDQFLAFALQHSIYPQVYGNWQRLVPLKAPMHIGSELKNYYQMNAVLNELRAAELCRVLDALRRVGMPAIALKGLPLADFLYGDISLRVCADMDVFIPRSEVTRAFDLLISLGYDADFPRWVLNERMLDHVIQIPLKKTAGALTHVVEIHWGLFHSPIQETDCVRDIWRTAMAVNFRGVSTLALSPEWQLPYLLVHASRHNWQGLKWLIDIDAACSRDGALHYELVARNVKLANWDTFFHWGLSVCRLLLGTTTREPATFMLPHSEEVLLENLRRGESRWHIFRVLLRGEPTLARKAQLFSSRLFAPTTADYASFRVPESLHFLYYPLRILRLLKTVLSPARVAATI